MNSLTFKNVLRSREAIVPEGEQVLRIPDGFLTPSFIVTATCLAFKHDAEKIEYANRSHQSYLEAMQVPYVLTGIDNYRYERKGAGSRYSPVQLLMEQADVDRATERISNCIVNHCGKLPGITKLCEVIGEMHDNVRAHAGIDSAEDHLGKVNKVAGMSVAQIWKLHGKEDVIEFALADNGVGFLSECQRTGQDVGSHASAIQWCIQARHSTKSKDHDEFAQRMYGDHMESPMPGVNYFQDNDGNHHQGLGLDELMCLVKNYSGEVWIASGDSVFHSSPDRDCTVGQDVLQFSTVSPSWQGVIIACRFKLSELAKEVEAKVLDSDIQDFLASITDDSAVF